MSVRSRAAALLVATAAAVGGLAPVAAATAPRADSTVGVLCAGGCPQKQSLRTPMPGPRPVGAAGWPRPAQEAVPPAGVGASTASAKAPSSYAVSARRR